ncbi:MAG: DegT/DnrJ/EryC1/StrS family aminotransferase [Anaerolineae bacterium]
MNIGIASPSMGEAEKRAVLAVMDSGHLVQGKITEAFESEFAAYHGVRFGVAVNNGTTGLIAALMAHSIGPGDEVIIPSFSFFATASAVLFVGAKPVFADIDPITFCLSPEAVEATLTPRTAAIMPVHLFGLPADMPRYAQIADQHHLLLLEDAAQAHGASVEGRRVGTWGTASFSFYPSKNMTTGEGGMVLTNDEKIADKLRIIRNQGMSKQYRHELVGFNFRLTDLASAIGRAQLEQLPEWTKQRQQNAQEFTSRLTSVRAPFAPDGYDHVYHQYTVRVPEDRDRDEAVKRLNERGIGARVYYPMAIHHQPIMQELGYGEADLPETTRATRSVFSLPVHPRLSQDERDYIVEEVNALW